MFKSKKEKMELNKDFVRAFEIMENTDKNVFLTGKAGTGKSTLLEYFRSKTRKNIVVLAPTGVAALNVKGQTIHSFFGFKTGITSEQVRKIDASFKNPDIYKKIDTIVIDEISMVRADLLDCVDKFMKLNGPSKSLPFGGVQMIFIGDLYQLPPVVANQEKAVFENYYNSPYFFSAKLFTDSGILTEEFKMEFIELEKIYRQKDADFISLLNSIRNNSIGQPELDQLNKKYIPDYEANKKEMFIYLTTTNSLADEINRDKLDKIKGKERVFAGEVSGDFSENVFPTHQMLSLKKGAQIMMLNNDVAGRWVNGSIGKVMGFDKDDDSEEETVIVELDEGEIVFVKKYTWDIFDYTFDSTTKNVSAEVIGSFTQYPMRLAWAVTIHKSQGKTFDKVIVDIGKGTFAHGQAYVALSRCRSFEGLVLKKKIEKKHIWMDHRVVKFLTHYQYLISEENLPLEKKIEILKEAAEKEKVLSIVYLKADDTKSERKIRPIKVGENQYLGKKYLGVSAFCFQKGEVRMFRVDRILQLKIT